MTPIKTAIVDGNAVCAEDWAGERRLVCLAVDEEQAKWLGYTIGRAHAVEARTQAGELIYKPDVVVD